MYCFVCGNLTADQVVLFDVLFWLEPSGVL